MSVTTYEEEASNIMAVKVCCDAPSVSHLLFVDDSLILIRADGTNATSLQTTLDNYYAASGQLVSKAKPLLIREWRYAPL